MAWVNLSPQNSFSADGLAARVASDGVVGMRGVVQYGGLSPSQPFATLPAEMRPAVAIQLPLRVEPDLAYPFARLIVRPNGDCIIDLRRPGVRPPDAPLGGPWEPVSVSARLDGVTFLI